MGNAQEQAYTFARSVLHMTEFAVVLEVVRFLCARSIFAVHCSQWN